MVLHVLLQSGLCHVNDEFDYHKGDDVIQIQASDPEYYSIEDQDRGGYVSQDRQRKTIYMR